MSDVLITPASSKIEFKDASSNIDGTIKLDSDGNLELTSNNGISFGDTSSDVFIGNGTDNVDLKFEADGSITGTSGVTLTLGSSNSNVKLISNELQINATSGIITATTFSGNLVGIAQSARGISNKPRPGYRTGTTSQIGEGLEEGTQVSIGLTIGLRCDMYYDQFNQNVLLATGNPTHATGFSGTIKIRTNRGVNNATNADSLYRSGNGSSFVMSNSSGDVGIGLTSGQLNVGDSSSGNFYNGFLFDISHSTMLNCSALTAGANLKLLRRDDGNALEFVDRSLGNTTVGSITIDTSANTTTYNTTSDYRLKENVVGITSALDKINQLRPVNFNMIGKTTKLDGFIAHEVQLVVPYAVHGEKDAVKTVKDGDLSNDGSYEDEVRIAALPTKEVPDYQQLDYSKLVGLLTASIQELSAKNDALEARIKALESGGS